jgi:lactate dehydrogenase-like 2-hydroxyacid dehydrogenase
MLARMDIVSINCPHTPATFHLISARRIKLMKPDAYLVNTARGEVIDEAALIRALETGELAGAGLDVFENEPNSIRASRRCAMWWCCRTCPPPRSKAGSTWARR